MIPKKYRLTESELRKVFRYKKPFFSYQYIANVRKNHLGYTRVALLLSGKVAPGSVNRNAFRRIFYDSACEIWAYGYDIVIIPKKGIRLNHKNAFHRDEFRHEIRSLFQQILAS